MTPPRAPLLLCASSSRTGPVEGLISVARILRAEGLDARIAADSVQPGDVGAHLSAASVPWERELRLSRKVRPADLLHDVWRLRAWLAAGRFDLLHTSFSHDQLVCRLALSLLGPRRGGLRLLRTAHRRADLDPGRMGHRLRALREADGVVVHAESYRRLLLARGLDPARVRAIPGAVDARRFCPGPGGAELRARWGIPPKAPLAGIVARMKPERGHAILLRAFADTAARVPDAHLVLVGRGESQPDLQQLARELPAGAGARVVFPGYAAGDELVAAYRALDLAVWLREGNDGGCRGVLEAMACGVPVVAGAEGASGELVRDGVEGAVVAPDDPQAIAQALARLLSDAPLRQRCAQAARQRAHGFDERSRAAAWLSFWSEVRELPRTGATVRGPRAGR